MQTCQFALRERCAPVADFARRRRILLGATATCELGIPPLACAVRLTAAYGLLVALTALPARAQLCTPPPSGMVAWWPMEDQAGDVIVDDIIGGDDGTPMIFGSPTTIGSFGGPQPVTGFFVGNSLLFELTYAEVAHTPNLEFGLSAFTIDAWVNFYPLGQTRAIVSKLDPSSGTGYFLSVERTGVGIFELTLQVDGMIFTGPVIPASTWSFIAATRQGDSVRLFVGSNSILADVTLTGAGSLNASSGGPLWIGQSQMPAMTHSTSEIDELEIFNRALPLSEIQPIFDAGSAGKCKCLPLKNGSDCTQTVCPDPNEFCRPTQVVDDPSTGQSTVTECDCGCWIMRNDVPPFEPLFCAGDSCPGTNRSCKLTATPNNDGTITYDCCRPCASPPLGMVAWWALDETRGAPKVNDFAPAPSKNDYGNPKPGGVVGNIISLGNEAPEPVVGVVDGALWFFNHHHVEVPTNANGDLDLGTDDFSIDAWIKVTSGGFNLPIVDKFDPSSNTGPGFVFGSDFSGLYLDINGTPYYSNPSSLGFGSWTHVAVTVERNPATIFFYINGAQEGSFTQPSPLSLSVNNNLPLWIGQSRWYFTQGDLVIDELEIFKRVLLPGEIEDIFKAGGAGKCKCDPGLAPGACCLPLPNGSCFVTSQECCTELGGTFLGAGTFCLGDFSPKNGIDDACAGGIIGGCCDTLNGVCSEGILAADCVGDQRIWTKDATCAEAVCDPALGACCDQDAIGTCTVTTVMACDCKKCVWHKLLTCAQIECTHAAIPTVSAWGLVVLTLLLLIGAKIYFARRRTATAS